MFTNDTMPVKVASSACVPLARSLQGHGLIRGRKSIRMTSTIDKEIPPGNSANLFDISGARRAAAATFAGGCAVASFCSWWPRDPLTWRFRIAFLAVTLFLFAVTQGESKMVRVFQQTFNLGPTLAANHVFALKMPFDAQLVHVSCSNSTANAGTLKIGKTGDDDAYLLAENFGSVLPVWKSPRRLMGRRRMVPHRR
jgi:hypothetical protein